MENPILKAKNDLMKWISNLDDLDVLSELMEFKEKNIDADCVEESRAEYAIADDFDKQFAAGMTSDELLENVFAHIDTLNWKNG